MKKHDAPRPDLPEELRTADDLLSQADALLQRHRGQGHRDAEAAAPADDDLPVLTEVVDSEFDTVTVTEPDSPAERSPMAESDLAEHLVALDATISLELERWIATELPPLIARELDSVAERVRVQALAHMRATLLPTLSERIADHLQPRDYDAD
jgi:hypothetical protein